MPPAQIINMRTEPEVSSTVWGMPVAALVLVMKYLTPQRPRSSSAAGNAASSSPPITTRTYPTRDIS
eukprot:COSAG01_NODE_23_length_37704_cov_30.005877_14_plen_67_part_00